MTDRYIEDPEIRDLRVRTWVRSVRFQSKLNLVQLEEKFSNTKSSDKKARSCIWEKYVKATVVPRVGKNPSGGLHLASRVEEEYPGTLQWLISPMWRLLDKAPMSMKEIRGIYEGMPYLYRSIFIEQDYKITGVFWRRVTDPAQCIATLLNLEKVDSFIALLALAKEAEITQNQPLHFEALKGALGMKNFLDKVRELDFTNEEIIEYLFYRIDNAGYFVD